MVKSRNLIVVLLAVLLIGAIAAVASATAQTNAPSMTVTPQSGVRPLTVVVKGTSCALSPATNAAPHQIRISWQVVDEPWTAQTQIIADGQNGDAWMTTLVLGVANIGNNIIQASCFSAGGQQVLEYPDQKVEVLPVAPSLSASPTSILVGESLTATATQCPDPDGPILGGGYFVRFTLEYLVPPSGTQGPFSESTTVWTDQSGVASTIFTLPTTAPTEGGAYRLSASCQLEELGSSFEVFAYGNVAIQVSAQPEPTPTPTASPEPTATPTATPQPTATPAPTATPGPTSTPGPTATPQPTSTPAPTPTPRPGGGGVIIFTG